MSGSSNEHLRAAAKELFADAVGPKAFPWYDSYWLAAYARAQRFLAHSFPAKVSELEALVEPFRTTPSFQVRELPGLLDASQLGALRDEVERVLQAPLSTYEREAFGRDLMHDRPVFNELQDQLIDQMSDAVGEVVEPYYNFLSLYGPKGVCAPHMDTPQAKWTLDICIDQSLEWPIHVSPVVPWPVDWDAANEPDWQNSIRSTNTFTSHVMQPGDAVVFAGSSQWHYRDPMPATSEADYCHLLFLHYVPAGTQHHVEPENWSALLDVPALSAICDGYAGGDQSAKGFHAALRVED